MKSLGMREHAVRSIFIIESAHHRRGRHPVRLDPRLPALLRLVAHHDLQYADGDQRPDLQIYYSPMHYIVAGGISLVCCTGAAFFPARKATRVHPVEIIRGAS